MSQKKYTIILLSFLAFLVSLVIFLYNLDAKQKEQALFNKFDEQIELRNKYKELKEKTKNVNL